MADVMSTADRPAGMSRFGRQPTVYTLGDQSGTAKEWANRVVISPESMRMRLKQMPLADALTAPPAPGKVTKPKSVTVQDVRGDYVASVVENSTNPDNHVDLEGMLLAAWDAGMARGICNPMEQVGAAVRNLVRSIEAELASHNPPGLSCGNIAELLQDFKEQKGCK